MLTRPCRHLCQQRRLAYAGFAAHDDRASLRSDAIDEIFDERDLALAPVQASRGLPLDHPAASLCRAATAGMRHLVTQVPAWELLRRSLDEYEGRVGGPAPTVRHDHPR